MMALVYGLPDAGKSTLADRLSKEHGFEVVATDGIYARYIEEHCPDLYFPRLSEFILVHWHYVVLDGMKRNIVSGVLGSFRRHLMETIRDRLRTAPRLVVEGYHVGFLTDDMRKKLAEIVPLVVVRVVERKYLVDEREVSVAEIAAWDTPQRS